MFVTYFEHKSHIVLTREYYKYFDLDSHIFKAIFSTTPPVSYSEMAGCQRGDKVLRCDRDDVPRGHA